MEKESIEPLKYVWSAFSQNSIYAEKLSDI